MVTVSTKEYCSICLETGFISEDFCVKILVVVVVLKNLIARLDTVVYPFKNCTFSRYVGILKSRTSIYAI